MTESTAEELGGQSPIDPLVREMAHSINNPLSALMMDLDLALDLLDREGEERPDSRIGQAFAALREARDAAEQIRRVVSNLQPRLTPETEEPVSTPRPLESPGEPAGGTPERGPLRVLVVDDDEFVARALARCLRGCEVVVADSGKSALDLIERGERFGVIICDLMMPHMTGMDLHEALQKIAPRQVDRMLFLSGGALTTRARQFVTAVTNPLMDKPFDVNRLRELVRTISSRHE